jgi:hypothetical protein
MSEAVPFTISGIHSGLAEAEGLMRLEDDVLTLECETKDTVMGVLKSGVKEFHIPLSALDSVSYNKRLFGARIRIQAKK